MTGRNVHGQKSGWGWRAASGSLGLAMALLCSAITVRGQQATYAVLYTFTGGADGANPQAYLIRDPEGNLYSTAFSGGDTSKCGGAGCGVVFKLDANNNETVLYTFEAGTDGAGPAAGLLWDQGNLYSTTHGGGDLECTKEIGVPWQGCGVVFEVNPKTGTETALYAFTGVLDGGGPSSGVVRDHAGNLYGATVFGGDLSDCSFFGIPGCGVVYKVDPSGNEAVLHAFTGGADGAAPSGNLFLDQAGDVLGAAGDGGDTTSTFCGQTILPLSGLPGCGTLFKIDPAGGLAVLYMFHGTDGGPFPIGYGWLIQDHAGNFYGMTGNGGDLSDCSGFGCGVVFKLDRSGKEIVLHRFTGGADGSEPSASVISDRAGNLYGTTWVGGDVTDPPCAAVGGCGVVFKLDAHGHETVLHTFTGGSDGANPTANLLLDQDGNLYGTAQDGGDTGCSVPGTPLPGCGVVFKITLHPADQ
jgi:uncharacterized repeat protein (TIGR03803 family)